MRVMNSKVTKTKPKKYLKQAGAPGAPVLNFNTVRTFINICKLFILILTNQTLKRTYAYIHVYYIITCSNHLITCQMPVVSLFNITAINTNN